jgi:hypothetical protein
MEHEDPLQCSQELAIVPYSKSDEVCPYPPTLFFLDPL